MTTITDSLKQLIDDLDIERHVTEATESAEAAVFKAIEKAGDYAHTHTDDLERWLDKAGGAIEDRTNGAYTETWDKVREQVTTLWGRLADKRPTADEVADVVRELPKR